MYLKHDSIKESPEPPVKLFGSFTTDNKNQINTFDEKNEVKFNEYNKF